MKKKWLIIVAILSICIIAIYGYIQYDDYKTEKEMVNVIQWQQMPEFIETVKNAKNNHQLVDIKKYPFLSDKGFRAAGEDYEGCVWISKAGYIADVIYYCEQQTNFNREHQSTYLKKKLSDHWYWCKYYM